MTPLDTDMSTVPVYTQEEQDYKEEQRIAKNKAAAAAAKAAAEAAKGPKQFKPSFSFTSFLGYNAKQRQEIENERRRLQTNLNELKTTMSSQGGVYNPNLSDQFSTAQKELITFNKKYPKTTGGRKCTKAKRRHCRGSTRHHRSHRRKSHRRRR
jgi:hypothetical protein